MNTLNLNTESSLQSAFPIFTSNAVPTIEPAPGFRRVLISYRAPSKGAKPKASNKVVDIPVLTFKAAPQDSINTLVSSLLMDVQDSIIRATLPESDTNLAPLPLAAIDMDAILTFGQQQAAAKRLSKEGIASYYDTYLMDAVIVRFLAGKGANGIEKLAASDSELLNKLLATSKDAYCKLAAVSPAINMATAKQLLSLLQFAEPDAGHPITKAITSKLDAIANPASDDELLAMLGGA